MKKKYLTTIKIIIFLFILFCLFIYPRPFKESDLSYLFEKNQHPLLIEYSGLFSGCKLNVRRISKEQYDSFKITDDFISKRYRKRFSPWIVSIDDVLYGEAYFYVLSFKECNDAIEGAFPNIRIESILSGKEKNSLIKIGGMAEYSIPLSHANTLLFLVKTDNEYLLITIKGGR